MLLGINGPSREFLNPGPQSPALQLKLLFVICVKSKMGKGGGDEPKSKLLSQEDTGLFSFGEGEGFCFCFCFFLSKNQQQPRVRKHMDLFQNKN